MSPNSFFHSTVTISWHAGVHLVILGSLTHGYVWAKAYRRAPEAVYNLIWDLGENGFGK